MLLKLEYIRIYNINVINKCYCAEPIEKSYKVFCKYLYLCRVN